MILYGVCAFIGSIFLKGVYDGYSNLQQNIRDEELKKRMFNMNTRWSIKDHAVELS